MKTPHTGLVGKTWGRRTVGMSVVVFVTLLSYGVTGTVIAAPDVTFSNIEVSALRDTSVVIQWDTDVPATGRIEYGLTAGYGNLTEIEDISYWHMMEIAGLAGCTSYHYRIMAKDTNGNETISDDYTFTTRTQAELEAIIKAARSDGELQKIYYMKPDGDDGKDGLSLGNAWETLSHAQDCLQSGDTLLIADGTYTNDTFVAQASGIPEAPITIKALSGTPKFIESGTTRTLKLFEFHNWGQPGPISYYNINGIIADNYGHACSPWRESHHLNFVNITSHNCSMLFRPHRGCHHVLVKDCKAYDSWWAPYHLWYYNHHLRLENIYAEVVNDHGLIDFHTDNDYITVLNASFHGRMDKGEAIYFHGDSGTNDNNVLKNIEIEMDMEADRRNRECLDIWTIGLNNYFDNLSLSHVKGESTIIAIGTSGEGLLEGNFTMKNVVVKNPGSHGLYIEPASDAGKILFENITFEGTHVLYRYDVVIHRPQKFEEIIFRDIKGDNNNFEIRSYDGLPNREVIEFTDGRVFSENYADTDPRYYPDKSFLSVEEEGTGKITYYTMTAVPLSGYATVVVNKFDTSLAIGEVLVDFNANSADTNAVTFSISGLIPNEDYEVTRDGASFATLTASDEGAAQFVNSQWPLERSFTIKQTTGMTGTLTGTVTAQDTGDPIKGSTITANTLSSTTDDNGNYIIIGLLPDTYIVTASMVNYLTRTDNATITRGNTTTLDFQMQPGDGTPPVVTLKTITVSGSVDGNAVNDVEINGTSVPIASGAYSHEVDVTSTDTITIIATNGKGEKVTRTIEIK